MTRQNTISMTNFKTRFKFGPLFPVLNGIYRELRYRFWVQGGRDIPPPHEVKQKRIFEANKNRRLSTFVETGTYRGKMVFAMRPLFDRVHSIEVDQGLADRARDLFSVDSNVRIHLGDSAQVLPEILSELESPALFWLDGHFSGGGTGSGEKETPILEELDAILTHRVSDHLVLIDDAHCIDGSHDYPTVDGLRDFVRKRRPDLDVEVVDNVIQVVPGKGTAH